MNDTGCGAPRSISLWRFVLPALALAFAAACYVPSVQPFFTRELVVSRPPVTGLWTHQENVYEFGSRISRRAGSGISGPIESTFFLVDGQLFLDTTAGKIKKEEEVYPLR